MPIGDMMQCTCCESERVGLLGTLGKLAWYECRMCGMKFSCNRLETPEAIESDYAFSKYQKRGKRK